MWRIIAVLAWLLPLQFVVSNPIKAAGFHNSSNNHFDGENPSIWFKDQDGDGYGNPSISVTDSVVPTGFVSESTDCNDSDATVHPMALEICNSIDDNCDNSIDEGFITATISPLATITIYNTSQITFESMADSTYGYQWLINGVEIEGATGSSYTTHTAGSYSV